MKELRIFDKRKEINAIIEIGRLIEVINKIDIDILPGKWKIYKGSNGYGEDICKIEDLLDKKEFIEVDGKQLFDTLLKGDQYFYHLEMEKNNSNLGIGIFDSTYLYLKSDNNDFINIVRNKFKETKVTEI